MWSDQFIYYNPGNEQKLSHACLWHRGVEALSFEATIFFPLLPSSSLACLLFTICLKIPSDSREVPPWSAALSHFWWTSGNNDCCAYNTKRELGNPSSQLLTPREHRHCKVGTGGIKRGILSPSSFPQATRVNYSVTTLLTRSNGSFFQQNL